MSRNFRIYIKKAEKKTKDSESLLDKKTKANKRSTRTINLKIRLDLIGQNGVKIFHHALDLKEFAWKGLAFFSD